MLEILKGLQHNGHQVIDYRRVQPGDLIIDQQGEITKDNPKGLALIVSPLVELSESVLQFAKDRGYCWICSDRRGAYMTDTDPAWGVTVMWYQGGSYSGTGWRYTGRFEKVPYGWFPMPSNVKQRICSSS